MSIDDLRAFILVATERSVTKAAARLEVSQQSVSERIRRLEGRLGVKLFVRRPYGMRPSAAGFQFLTYATQCVDLIDQAVAVISDTDLLRVQLQSSVASAVSPRLDGLVAAKRVKITVSDDGDSEATLAGIGAGAIDVGIGVFGGAPDPSAADATDRIERANGDAQPDAEAGVEIDDEPDPYRVVTEALFADPVVWAAPPDHPLAQRAEPISVAQFFGPGVRSDAAGGPGSAHGFEDLRVAARSVLQEDLAAGRLVELPLDQPNWVVPISIAYRANDHDRPSVVAVREALKASANHAAGDDPGSPPSTPGGAPPAS